ncbi:DUF4214 domain-containing protein [Melaminivora suipulveris]|nr:DUF4214 domain-containing protein [Melaminivora suipulveris]
MASLVAGLLLTAGAAPVHAAPDTAEQVQEVYLAFYGRPGDPDGVSYWAAQAGSGGVASILDQFSGSVEASQLFSGMSDEGKVTFIYRILFNRDPDGPGLSYWSGELSSGQRTLQEISFEILRGARNDDAGKIANKIAAARYFTSQLTARNIKADYSVQADIFLARNWLGTIDETQASLNSAMQAIDALLGRISLAGKPQTVTGVLATPTGATQTARSAIKYMAGDIRAELQRQAAEVVPAGAAGASGRICFGVPDGYTPLANASVEQYDAFDKKVGASGSADNCGLFVLPTQPMTMQLAISAPGYRPVRAPVAVFQDPNKDGLPDALTLIPTTSQYVLTGLRLTNGNQLYFNVTDSATKKAVLGVGAAQISVLNNAAPLPVAAVGYGSYISNKPASVALVLDASGSMDDTALQIAAASARLFVGRKGSADELSLTIFDGNVVYLDKVNTQQMIDQNRLVFTDGSGQRIIPNAPESGYTTNPLFAEQMLKLYDSSSDAWRGTDPFLRIQGRYPFGGITALYKASVTAARSLKDTPNRRYIVAMTDGADNASSPDNPTTVINTAKANNVVAYTIGAGYYVDSASLQNIANQTGGSYTQVTDLTQLTKLSSVFDAIRTSITFDYAAVLARRPATGEVTLQVDIGGNVISSKIQVP